MLTPFRKIKKERKTKENYSFKTNKQSKEGLNHNISNSQLFSLIDKANFPSYSEIHNAKKKPMTKKRPKKPGMGFGNAQKNSPSAQLLFSKAPERNKEWYSRNLPFVEEILKKQEQRSKKHSTTIKSRKQELSSKAVKKQRNEKPPIGRTHPNTRNKENVSLTKICTSCGAKWERSSQHHTESKQNSQRSQHERDESPNLSDAWNQQALNQSCNLKK